MCWGLWAGERGWTVKRSWKELSLTLLITQECACVFAHRCTGNLWLQCIKHVSVSWIVNLLDTFAESCVLLRWQKFKEIIMTLEPTAWTSSTGERHLTTSLFFTYKFLLEAVSMDGACLWLPLLHSRKISSSSEERDLAAVSLRALQRYPLPPLAAQMLSPSMTLLSLGVV